MGLPIICLKGSQLDFPNKYVLESLKIALIIANSADPDEKKHNQTSLLEVSSMQRVYSTFSDEFNHVMPLG